MNKSYEVTLIEQIDHQYLPKYREIFNRLDESHRFTNYDDFEIVSYNTSKYFYWLSYSGKGESAPLQRGATKLDLLKKQSTKSGKKLSNLKTNNTNTFQTFKTQNSRVEAQNVATGVFDQPRDNLDNKYVDIAHWPRVSEVNIYVDKEFRVVHLGAKYRFVNSEYTENEFTGF
jgi:hypothetical protein